MVSRETRIAQFFVGLADTLTDDFDVVEFMIQLVDACIELIEVDAAGLMLIDVRGKPRLVASSPDMMHDLEVFELQADEGPCLDVIQSGQAVVNVDVPQARERWPRFTKAALEVGLRSTHALPLKLRGELIGAINLFGRKEQDLSEEDVTLAQALADVAAIGLLQQRATREPSILADQLQLALNTRVLVEQAKGILAEHSGLKPAETFRFLRVRARQSGEPLERVAERVVTGNLRSVDVIDDVR